jgi:hypothetical protein
MRNTLAFIVVACAWGCTSTDDTTTSPPETPVADEDPSVDDSTPLLVLDVEPGHTVGFYEVGPGVLGMVEIGDHDDEFVVRTSDVRAVFEMLRPGEAPPEALRAAVDRALNMPLVPSVETRDHGVAETQHAVHRANDAVTFVNGGYCDAEDWDSAGIPVTLQWVLCRANLSGDWWAWVGGAQTAQGNVWSISGSVTGRATAGEYILTKSISSGKRGHFEIGQSAASLRRIDVYNADGDSYNVSVWFGNCGGCWVCGPDCKGNWSVY